MKIIFLLSLLIIISVLPLSFAQEKTDVNNLEDISLELIQEKKFDEALEYLEKIIELDQNNTFAYNNKGAILIEQENYDESIIVLNKSLEINGNNTEAWNNKGLAYSKKLDLENALSSFYKAIKIDSKNQIAFDNLQKLSKVVKLHDYNPFGYGLMQIWDSNMNLIGSSKIHSIGLLPQVGIEVVKERSKVVEINEKNYFVFHTEKPQAINTYVGGIDLFLFKDSEQIIVGQFKTHGFIASAGNYYTYDIILLAPPFL
ncbi:tetratricopeptide repeat protein [Nitrosopumilus sp. S6]